jgi:pimeloyl-ACP methyl ester carboxylesterase
MPALRALPVALVLTKLVAAQQTISFPTQDGGRICADLYGKGDRAVVLAHGGRFTKESWRDQAGTLVSSGFGVLAIDFRGFGCSSGPGQADFDNAPFENDVLAAVRYLKTHGAKSVSVVGGSFGGGAAGKWYGPHQLQLDSTSLVSPDEVQPLDQVFADGVAFFLALVFLGILLRSFQMGQWNASRPSKRPSSGQTGVALHRRSLSVGH